MVDRGNIVVQSESDGRIYFYAHWRGSEVQEIARKALAKRWRWDDDVYLRRIVFDTLTEGESGKETGFGISTRLTDNENPIVVLDVDKQKVWLEDENTNPGPALSFCAFADGERLARP